MAYVLIRHTVEDYARWKPLFDQHDEVRRQYGLHGGSLFRDAANPNDLVLLLQADDQARAREFSQSDTLRQTMQRAGVTGTPEVFILEKIEDLAR